MRVEYADYLDSKSQGGADSGFEVDSLPSWLFDFQQHLTAWAIKKGRAAIFADCGMGKTPMQLVWADEIARRGNGNVLILTPLAVSGQTVREAEKFGIEATRSIGQPHRIAVTNYEKLHHFDPADFVGVVCDESSILKSFDGARKSEITQFMRKVPYRLLATATAAPNDYTELGTSSEALGYLGHMDMLNRFFKNDQNNSAMNRQRGEVAKWRFKGHAETPFWRWVCSWARSIRKPSDYGFDDGRFTLPPLEEAEHVVESRTLPDGMLFSLPAVGLREQRDERKRTVTERCEKVAAIVDDAHSQCLIWCHLNREGKALAQMIPDSVEISGDDSDERKEEVFLGFASGEIKNLITKPRIGAWGLNFQNCHRITFFPSHSFEQYYQGVRRCWRYGQTLPVRVDMVATEGERGIMDNLQRKAKAADTMFERITSEMVNALGINHRTTFTQPEEVPSWLS